jgi:hypothetical protein
MPLQETQGHFCLIMFCYCVDYEGFKLELYKPDC